MGLMERFRRRGRGTGRAGRRTPTFREMHARMRTERAEAKLMETEALIHREAARYRHGGRHTP
ncbi:hypothetical protein [Actinomadura sp. 21ATH]|uniref:hypothetical protein n=1 Tax=Actinomadura sp. 21ATH TaxID=1735444 RepID=UPI0035BFC43C